MSDLMEFLRARLDEGERVAKAAMKALAAEDGIPMWPDYQMHDSPELDTAHDYLAQFQPARILREVEAKRRIIGEHPITSDVVTSSGEFVDGFGCQTCHERDGEIGPAGYCRTLKLLALPYADHPDYDESWRP